MGHHMPHLQTSPHDHRAYRYLTLANQLRVLLIEDHKTEKSAAALAVQVGIPMLAGQKIADLTVKIPTPPVIQKGSRPVPRPEGC